jgi:hypothetical protein
MKRRYLLGPSIAGGKPPETHSRIGVSAQSLQIVDEDDETELARLLVFARGRSKPAQLPPRVETPEDQESGVAFSSNEDIRPEPEP